MDSKSVPAAKAAFETTKGARHVMTLSEADVEQYLDLRALLDGLEDGFRGLELGEVQSPPRPEITVPGKGFSLAMPAWRPGMPIGVKVVNVFDGNLDLGLPNHLALIMLFDQDTGATCCVMDGTYITGIRTTADSPVRAHQRVLAALPRGGATRGPQPARARSVGYHPPAGELPTSLGRDHRLFVETLDAFEPTPVGCAELAGLDRGRATTLGNVALGRAPGRLNDAEITVYKAMGIAMEDLVAANLAYQRARQQQGGGVMIW